MANQPQGKPPKHGQIKVATMPAKHAKAHLDMMTEGAAEMRDYHTGGVTGQGAQGSFAPGGASAGADYTTTSTGNTGDADSGGPSGW
jgi:hypothetical protein